MRSRFPSFVIAFAVLAIGCSSSSDSNNPPADGGGDTGGGDAGTGDDGAAGDDGGDLPAGSARLTGQLVQLGGTQGVASAKITAGAQTGTTDDSGKFSLVLPTGQPFTIAFSADSYATLTEESATITGSFELGPTPLLNRSTVQLLTMNLPGYDETLGMVAINVIAESSCPSEEGATLIASAGGKTTSSGGAAGDPHLVYFAGGLPSTSATSVQKGATPGAIAYNLPLGEVTVAAQHPSCTPVVSPVTEGEITYSGKVQVGPAKSATLSLSFLRAFLAR